MRQVTLIPEFVETIPNELKQGILYISKKYGIANHLCACGCGMQTVTSLKPNWDDGWDLIENEGMVSLSPSIGNQKLPCKSHYIVTNNIATFCDEKI